MDDSEKALMDDNKHLQMPDKQRRQTLMLLGSAICGLASRASSAASVEPGPTVPACLMTPQQTEGPFFVDKQILRSDIRTDPLSGKSSEGTPLVLILRIISVGHSSCTPVSGALVDIWHCDANGRYSAVAQSEGAWAKSAFLRGYQISGSDGSVRFTTIYPGWYPGRAVHIHFKVRTRDGYPGREFVSQLYFDEATTDTVHATDLYAQRGRRDVTNTHDEIFLQDNGKSLLIKPVKTPHGYAAEFDVGVRV